MRTRMRLWQWARTSRQLLLTKEFLEAGISKPRAPTAYVSHFLTVLGASVPKATPATEAPAARTA